MFIFGMLTFMFNHISILFYLAEEYGKQILIYKVLVKEFQI